MPHCCGAVDGNHVRMQALPNTGSENYNYKGFHSLVLMATCDVNYNFTMVKIGAPGRQGDSTIFRSTEMSNVLATGSLNFPDPDFIHHQISDQIPYFLVGDWGMKHFH